jgi:hypothetical protein
VIAVVAIAFLSKAALDQFFWRFSGPVSLVTLLILLTVYLRRRGIYWSGMGLRAVPGAKSKWLMVPQTLAGHRRDHPHRRCHASGLASHRN